METNIYADEIFLTSQEVYNKYVKEEHFIHPIPEDIFNRLPTICYEDDKKVIINFLNDCLFDGIYYNQGLSYSESSPYFKIYRKEHMLNESDDWEYSSKYTKITNAFIILYNTKYKEFCVVGYGPSIPPHKRNDPIYSKGGITPLNWLMKTSFLYEPFLKEDLSNQNYKDPNYIDCRLYGIPLHYRIRELNMIKENTTIKFRTKNGYKPWSEIVRIKESYVYVK